MPITLFGVGFFSGGRWGSAVTRRLLPQLLTVQVRAAAHTPLCSNGCPHGIRGLFWIHTGSGLLGSKRDLSGTL